MLIMYCIVKIQCSAHREKIILTDAYHCHFVSFTCRVQEHRLPNYMKLERSLGWIMCKTIHSKEDRIR
jgi:hypothetical protein